MVLLGGSVIGGSVIGFVALRRVVSFQAMSFWNIDQSPFPVCVSITILFKQVYKKSIEDEEWIESHLSVLSRSG